MLKRISLQSWGWECFKQDTNGINNNKKKKFNTLNCIEIKNICISKDTTKRKKRKATKWEKIFAVSVIDK